MIPDELERLELLAEVDSLLARVRHWLADAPRWMPAAPCRALVDRLLERAGSLRIRLESPLVVATLGGTGTGKSTLVNALVGDEVAPTGKARPTTVQPILICRPGIEPEMLGIDRAAVRVVHHDAPALGDLVLIDCPDPDTTESSTGEGLAPDATNLARLRTLLPHCDVVLVTATQQKYRSARVAGELAEAARGARLVFVQTHADSDDDIRDDWQRVLEPDYAPGRLFRVDSLAALRDAKQGLAPRGEFGRLVDLLARELSGAAGNRIRRANFLDLVEETLAACRRRIDAAMPAVDALEAALAEYGAKFNADLAESTRSELLTGRRAWEQRLLGQVAERWGLSPFSLTLRVYQGLGGLLSGAMLYRMRTPAQLALWGAVEGTRVWRQRSQTRQATLAPQRAAAAGFDSASLQAAAIVVEGYTVDAGLHRELVCPDAIRSDAEKAGAEFAQRVAGELQTLIARLAARHTGWLTRCRYELLFMAMLGFLLFRLGKNFFYDSWLAEPPMPVAGVDFYLTSSFWLVAWSLLLIGLLTGRLRRGLRREVDRLAANWPGAHGSGGPFLAVEADCRRARQFGGELDRLLDETDRLRRQVSASDVPLGARRLPR
ncbi:MAG: GTPase domain-containing protein [Patescibacteria group bacterium]|nr:GTPase domain-containing protein [Patescibacteria group bacterium]